MMKKIYQGIVFEITALESSVMKDSPIRYLSIYDNTLEDPFV